MILIFISFICFFLFSSLFFDEAFYGGFLEYLDSFETKDGEFRKGVRLIFALPIFVVLAVFLAFSIDILCGIYNATFGYTFETFYFHGRF